MFLGGAGPGGSWHRIKPTVKNAISDYKKKLKLVEGHHPDLSRVPLILFVDGRTAVQDLDKDDLDLAFAHGAWAGGPSENYPEIPLGVIVLGTPVRGERQSGVDMDGDFIRNPYCGTRFPPVVERLLRPHRLRQWSGVKTLQQIDTAIARPFIAMNPCST